MRALPLQRRGRKGAMIILLENGNLSASNIQYAAGGAEWLRETTSECLLQNFVRCVEFD
jgi:hypothetical protein